MRQRSHQGHYSLGPGRCQHLGMPSVIFGIGRGHAAWLALSNDCWLARIVDDGPAGPLRKAASLTEAGAGLEGPAAGDVADLVAAAAEDEHGQPVALDELEAVRVPADADVEHAQLVAGERVRACAA